MSGEAAGTGATPTPNETPAAGATPAITEGTPAVTPDPREEALGDKGKELLKELRTENKTLATQLKEIQDRFKADDDKVATAAKEKSDKEAADAKAALDKDKSETDKLQERLDAMQARLV